MSVHVALSHALRLAELRFPPPDSWKRFGESPRGDLAVAGRSAVARCSVKADCGTVRWSILRGWYVAPYELGLVSNEREFAHEDSYNEVT